MKNEFFESEKKMQEWLSEQLNSDVSIGDLITNIDEFEEYKAESIEAKKVFNSFSYTLKSIHNNVIISEGSNISLKLEDSLKPDFLLYALETETIVIVEIKNTKHATREGGTEVGAYASEIKSYVPFISDGDIVSVIISPEWPTLIRHYVFHDIFWLQRNIICLTPIKVDDEILLKIVDIDSIIESNSSLKIGYNHLGGYQLCLYDYDLYSGSQNRNRYDPYVQQMKTALNAMAAKGNSHKSHGFAFLWKDNWEISLAPYNITIMNFAPFQSVERFFHEDDFEPNLVMNKLVNIIKGFEPQGHGATLNSVTRTGRQFVEHFCEPRMEAFTTWDVHEKIMLERGELISFQAWGVFGELYSEKLLESYRDGEIDIASDCPKLGLQLVNELVNPNYEFINLAYYDFE